MADVIPSVITTVVATIISAIVSYFVAKIKAENEINKLYTTYNREDEVKLKEDFSALMVETEHFCSFAAPINKQNAIRTNTNFLAIAPKQFKELLLNMDKVLKAGDTQKTSSLREQLLNLYSQTIQNTY